VLFSHANDSVKLDKQQADLDLQSSQAEDKESGVCPATLGTSHIWENRVCSNCGISQDQAIVSASLTLQSHWRGKKARKVYKELKAEFRERQEAIDREKKELERQHAELEKQKREEEEKNKREEEEDRKKEEELKQQSSASVTLQSHWRGKKARGEYKEFKERELKKKEEELNLQKAELERKQEELRRQEEEAKRQEELRRQQEEEASRQEGLKTKEENEGKEDQASVILQSAWRGKKTKNCL